MNFTHQRIILCPPRSEEHTSELQSQSNLVCRLLLEKKKKYTVDYMAGPNARGATQVLHAHLVTLHGEPDHRRDDVMDDVTMQSSHDSFGHVERGLP